MRTYQEFAGTLKGQFTQKWDPMSSPRNITSFTYLDFSSAWWRADNEGTVPLTRGSPLFHQCVNGCDRTGTSVT